jgi:hypothetical protein
MLGACYVTSLVVGSNHVTGTEWSSTSYVQVRLAKKTARAHMSKHPLPYSAPLLDRGGNRPTATARDRAATRRNSVRTPGPTDRALALGRPPTRVGT